MTKVLNQQVILEAEVVSVEDELWYIDMQSRDMFNQIVMDFQTIDITIEDDD